MMASIVDAYRELYRRAQERSFGFVRFCFFTVDGAMKSITTSVPSPDQTYSWHMLLSVPASALVQSAGRSLIEDNFAEKTCYLIPDLDSCFEDPFATNPTLVVFCSVKQFEFHHNDTATNHQFDTRSCLEEAEKVWLDSASTLQTGSTVVNFTFSLEDDRATNTNHDPAYNIRSEIYREASQAGIECLQHYSLDGKQQHIVISASGALRAADSIQKLGYIARNIIASYNCALSYCNAQSDALYIGIKRTFSVKEAPNELRYNPISSVDFAARVARVIGSLLLLTTPTLPDPLIPSHIFCRPLPDNLFALEYPFVSASSNPYLAFTAILLSEIASLTQLTYSQEAESSNPVDYGKFPINMPRSSSEALQALKESRMSHYHHLISTDLIKWYYSSIEHR